MRRTWGEETVVYDPLSGSTHLVDSVSGAVLDCLSAGDGSAAVIVESLLSQLEDDSEEDVLEAVQAALAKLRNVGLVRSVEE